MVHCSSEKLTPYICRYMSLTDPLINNKSPHLLCCLNAFIVNCHIRNFNPVMPQYKTIIAQKTCNLNESLYHLKIFYIILYLVSVPLHFVKFRFAFH